MRDPAAVTTPRFGVAIPGSTSPRPEPVQGVTAERGALAAGEIIAERYEIESTLGEGGMGVVYLAEHVHMRKRFALKVLLRKWTANAQVLARFEREAVAAGQIDHPNVVAATDFGRLDDGAFFLVLEHVDGKTLRGVLDETGPLEPARAFHIVRGVLCAAAAAHAKGIVHRDLKPENVMLVTRDGDDDFVKVLDFGIAKVDASTASDGAPGGLTQAGMVIGTPDYMPPEQALGGTVDARSDLYSIGVILFEMLTGARPFSGGAMTVIQQHLTMPAPALAVDLAPEGRERVAALVARLLEKDPAARFDTALDVVAALDACTTPPALEPVQGVMTPSAPKGVRSVLAGLRAVEAEVRRALADPKAALAATGRRRLIAAASVAVVVATTAFASCVVGGTRAPTSTAPEALSAAVVASTNSSPIVAPMPSSSAELAPVSDPPPAPSSSTTAGGTTPSSTGRPASARGRSRQTGPGGIYIPPPSQWFK